MRENILINSQLYLLLIVKLPVKIVTMNHKIYKVFFNAIDIAPENIRFYSYLTFYVYPLLDTSNLNMQLLQLAH